MIVIQPLETPQIQKIIKKLIGLMLPHTDTRNFFNNSRQQPEIHYNIHQTQSSPTNSEIPELEEDSDQDQFADSDYLIDQHNTHQESERIRHEYSARS